MREFLRMLVINRKVNFFIIILFIFLSIQNQASNYSSQFMSLDAISKSVDHGTVFGVLRFETMDYFTKIPEQENLNRQQYLSTRLGFISPNIENSFGYGGDFQAGKFNYGTSNYSVQELYSFFQFDKNFKIIGGRKKYDWNFLDSYWKTSFWQPNYAIDYLRPEEQGLFGVFFEYQNPEFQFVTYTTPMFIPNMGIDVREEGGELVSESRWFRQPSDKYDLNGKIKSIRYKLSVPEIRNLVSKPGAGVNLGIGNKNESWWISQSLGYKPVNELILKREGYSPTDVKAVNVLVSPDVVYHSLYSVDLGYTFQSFRFIASYLEDNPKDKIPDKGWVIQKLLPTKAYSLMIENNVESEIIKNLKVQLGYLRIYGSEIVDIDSEGNRDVFTLFDIRTKFNNSIMLKGQGQVFSIFRKSIITKLSYLKDFNQNGSLVNAEFQVFPTKKWAILLGGDFISVDEENTSSSFLNQYRANDRVYGGVNYVF